MKEPNQVGLIILDGPDACGKTTLQNYFIKYHEAVGIHLTYPAPDGLTMLEYQTREMMKAIEMSNTNLVIVDRHWISEKLYAEIFRDGSPWPMMGRLMSRVWNKHAAITILCLPFNIITAAERHEKEKDEKHPYDNEIFTRLLKRYTDFWEEKRQSPFYMSYRIEIEGLNLERFSETVLNRLRFLRKEQYAPALSITEHNITGHLLRARVLMVGHQLKPKPEFHERFNAYYPFFEHTNSSLYLTEILDALQIDEDRLMWTNAITMEFIKSPHIMPLYQRGVSRIIAFGNEVAELIAPLDIPFHKVYHPQYAKRFNVDGYKESLGDIFYVAR